MPKLRYLWIGPLIGFSCGFLLLIGSRHIFEPILAGATLAIIALLIQSLFQYTAKSILRSKQGFLKREKSFIKPILILAAEMAKADGEVSDSEVKLIEKRLKEDYEDKASEVYIKHFHTYLAKKNNIKGICKLIDFDINDSAKALLLYLLIGIATADGVLSETEITFLKKVTSLAGISITILVSTLKLFEFKREGYYEKQQSKSSHSRSTSSIEKAYATIGVTQNSSIDAIKKAYRTLAKLHHPDRVIHLGEEFQQSAKSKFQEISNAYEMIKTQRNFS